MQTTHNIRRDVFTAPATSPRMSIAQLDDFARREDIGPLRKLGQLRHQARAALIDGDIATAAHIERLKFSIPRPN